MGSNIRNPRIVHFGDCVLDLDTAELCRNGSKTSLQSQPFQILTALLENPGQLVTREHLIKRVWPNGTFVDFDQSLNKAVARLREALGDNAENPLYIETLSRRGYRFIGLMDKVDSETNSASRSKQHLERIRAPKMLMTLGVTVGVLLCIGTWLMSRNIPIPRVIDSIQITKDGQHKDVTLKLLSDGARLYFQEGSYAGPLSTVAPVFTENPSLVQVSTHGGETERIPVSLEEPLIYDLSAVRSEFLAGGGGNPLEHPLWALPLPTGPPRRVGNILALDACWSPDGNHLAYVKDNELFVASPDGTGIRRTRNSRHRGLLDPIFPRRKPATVHCLHSQRKPRGLGHHGSRSGWQRAASPAYSWMLW